MKQIYKDKEGAAAFALDQLLKKYRHGFEIDDSNEPFHENYDSRDVFLPQNVKHVYLEAKMNKTKKPLAIFLCVVIVNVLAAGCGLLKPASPKTEDQIHVESAVGANSEESGDPNDIKDILGLHGHEMPLKENPVAGYYITTSGILLNIGDDGSYSWDETSIGGLKATGKYEIYEGTLREFPNGTTEYVFESDTGPVYTLYIEFDQSDTGNTAPFTIQVFDTYTEDIFRVTDIIYGTQFEATDYLSALVGQGSWLLEQPENLVLKETSSTAIIASWDVLEGASGYRIAALPISWDDFYDASEKGEETPYPIFQGETTETEITIKEGLLSGQTYTVAVCGVKNGQNSLAVYKDITLK